MSKPNKRNQAKKKARAEALRQRKGASSAKAGRMFPLNDPYLSERMMRRVFLQHRGPVPSTMEDFEALISRAMATTRSIDEMATDRIALDNVEQAQELAFQAMAWEADGDFDKADRLAVQALRIDPDCLDARRLTLASQYDPDDLLPDIVRHSLQAQRTRERERLEARWGTPLGNSAPEPILRPYHRFLAMLLGEYVKNCRNGEAIEIALEASRLGPNGGMDIRLTMSWLLAGGHHAEADAHMEFLESRNVFERRGGETAPHLRWWASWSAFLAGDLARSKTLALGAEEAFPDSALLLFADTIEEDRLLEASPRFDANFEQFRTLMDALQDPTAYNAHVRAWLGMEDTSGP